MKQICICNKCGVELLIGFNWYKTLSMSNHHICKACRNDYYRLKNGSKEANCGKNSSSYLGCDVAERVLYHVFENVRRMPHNNPGYDFICSKGYKIDVKSSCLDKTRCHWVFGIKCNDIANYFLLLAFDNRANLNPQKIWLLKSNEIIRKRPLYQYKGLVISNSPNGLYQFEKYELDDKLEKVIDCCNGLKL